MRERKLVQEEEGPTLFPGMEELGIGSIRRNEERLADEFEEDARFERALEEYDDDPDDEFYDDEDEQESSLHAGMILDRESEQLIDGKELTAEDLKNLRPVGRGPYLFISCTFILLFLLLILTERLHHRCKLVLLPAQRLKPLPIRGRFRRREFSCHILTAQTERRELILHRILHLFPFRNPCGLILRVPGLPGTDKTPCVLPS